MDNRELELLNQQRLAEFYKKAMDICTEILIDFHKFKKNRLENGYQGAYKKLIEAKEYYQKVNRSTTLLTKYLNDPTKIFVHQRAYSFKSYEIENKLSKARNAAINDYTFIKTLELITSDNAIESMKQLVALYLDCYKRIRDIKNESKVKYINPKQSKKIDLNQLLELLKKKNNGLTPIELEQIQELLPDISTIRGIYYSTDTINKGLNIRSNIQELELSSEGKNTNYCQSPLKTICDTAALIFDTTTLSLLTDNDNKDFDSISNALELTNGIERYRKAYNSFNICYENMSRHSKEELRVEFESKLFDEYKNKFGITTYHILNPEELNNRINTYIKSYISAKSYIYTSLDFNEKTYDKLQRATSLMSTDDLVELYKAIFDNETQSYNYCINHTEALKLEPNMVKRTHVKKMVVLQDMFANLIASKISKLEAVKDTLNKDDLLQKELLLSMICNDYFHEVPKFGLSLESTELIRQTNNFRSNIEITTRERTRQRFFNLSQMEQSLARMNGTWKKFDELMQKDVLDNTDIEVLNKMFI